MSLYVYVQYVYILYIQFMHTSSWSVMCIEKKYWQCQNWFAKFPSGNFDVVDASHSGRPFKTDKGKIKALINNNSWNSWELKFVKFDRSFARETFLFSLKTWYMGSTCPYITKLVSSH